MRMHRKVSVETRISRVIYVYSQHSQAQRNLHFVVDYFLKFDDYGLITVLLSTASLAKKSIRESRLGRMRPFGKTVRKKEFAFSRFFLLGQD